MIVLTEEDKCNVEVITTHAINRFIERSDNKINKYKNTLLEELSAKTKKLNEGELIPAQQAKFERRLVTITREINDLELNYQNRVKEKIENLLKQTKRIYPKNYTMKLLNNKFENAEYYLNNDFVFVVSNKVLKTVMVYDKSRWTWFK